MKKLLLLSMMLFASCHSTNVVVWTVSDIIGLVILGIAILIIGIVFLRAWVLDTINSIKKRRK